MWDQLAALSRLTSPTFTGVVPVDARGTLLDAAAAVARGIDGLHGWLRKAEDAWNSRGEGRSISLTGNWNHHGKLLAQFPIANLRVVYAKAGTLPASCLLQDPRAVVDHKLYWMPVRDEAEGRYLTAILNSETARARIAQYQSRGQWGARDFDKVVFNLPIPRYETRKRLHSDLAAAAAEAERVAALVELPEGVKFQRARRLVRDALTEAGVAQRIDALVVRLLGGG